MINKDIAIKAKGLKKTFGSKNAVAGIDLEIKRGEIYGFLGPNGAGKSTTVKMLITLLAPSKGDAWINGKSIVSEPEDVRLEIGAALQEASLDLNQTGSEILRLQGRLYGLNKKEIEQRLTDLRSLINIGADLDKRIKTYSGGMKRRVDLAAALVHNPNILFLDEPTTGLDPVSRASVWEEIKRLNKELGMTIFLTTQYLEEADVLADRIGIISAGKLVAEDTPAALKKRIGNDVIVVIVDKPDLLDKKKFKDIKGVKAVDLDQKELHITTQDGGKVIASVVEQLNASGVAIKELSVRSATLDDVFLEVTGNRIKQDEGEKQ